MGTLIHENQTGFIPGRCISENIRILYDIIFETKRLNKQGLLLLIDFEKAFDTVSKQFIIQVMERFGFGPNIIKWVNILTSNTSASVVQNGHLSSFFMLDRGCRQGDPVSPYLFLFVVEILGIMIRDNPNIKGITLSNTEHKLGQFADDTQLFLDGSENSLNAAIETLNNFYNMSGLKMNVDKTKAIWIGSMSGSNMILGNDLKLDWHKGDFEILGITLNPSLKDLWVINTRKRIETINRMLANWRRRKLTLIGKITVIKTLAVSTLVHILSALPNPPKTFIDEINKIFYNFMWNDKKDKIKRTNIIRAFNDGGLRMIDIKSFINALKLSTVKRYLKKSTSSNNIFPLRYMFLLGANIKNYVSHIDNHYWRDVLTAWGTFYKKHDFDDKDIEQILTQPLWLNHHFESSYIVKHWFHHGIHFIKDICNENGILNFKDFKNRYKVKGTILDYQQLLNNIPSIWKHRIKNKSINLTQLSINSVFYDMLSDKKGSRIFYDKIVKIDKSIKVLEYWNDIVDYPINWKEVFSCYRKSTKDCKLLDFQYKFIYRIIYTKKELCKMNLVDDDICSFCKECREDILHVYFNCEHVKQFWSQIKTFINRNLNIELKFTKYNVMFGFCTFVHVINHILLSAKRFIYISSIKQENLLFDKFIILLRDICKVEYYIARKNNILHCYYRKWKQLAYTLCPHLKHP